MHTFTRDNVDNIVPESCKKNCSKCGKDISKLKDHTHILYGEFRVKLCVCIQCAIHYHKTMGEFYVAGTRYINGMPTDPQKMEFEYFDSKSLDRR
jgi:hypothetical protein